MPGLTVALINSSTKPLCSRLYKQEHIFTLQGYFVLAKTESTDLKYGYVPEVLYNQQKICNHAVLHDKSKEQLTFAFMALNVLVMLFQLTGKFYNTPIQQIPFMDSPIP